MNENWTDLVNEFEMSDEMKRTLIQNCKNKKRAGDVLFRYSKMIALGLGILVLGAFGVTGYAGVNYVQQRMELMPKEEVIERNEEIQSSQVNTDTYNREFSNDEKERYNELIISYHNGMFPEGEIERIETLDQANKDKIYYVISSGTFLLPDRELTDEEILQYIDYLYKVNYSLSQSEENLEIQKEEEAEQKAISEEIAANNGITEEDAVTSSANLMQEWFQLSAEGFECTHYAFEGDYGIKLGYTVCYSRIGIEHDFYYFTFNAENGGLERVAHSGSKMSFGENISKSDLTANIPALKQEAENYLLEVIGIQNKNYEIYYEYPIINDDKVNGNSISFLFVVSENEVYQIDWLFDVHEFNCYMITSLQSLEEEYNDYTLPHVYEKFVSE